VLKLLEPGLLKMAEQPLDSRVSSDIEIDLLDVELLLVLEDLRV